ncbi:Cation transport regulator-like protein 2 [Parelaphostrongylus tenuis]|uniref:glutathione-specific gamma-glutamylcyclotransferase n=1 Tax=Parelaphostrongylus tenuis TaxID=148309 RepID=A0AAD5R3E9_PARTN|nr:Cation transport regulator-like protein 2 [Parelaphostrongylus tenuis]
MWIFGYGSLLWNPNFPYTQKIPGVVKGYARRFWQLSPDHRGTPESFGSHYLIIGGTGQQVTVILHNLLYAAWSHSDIGTRCPFGLLGIAVKVAEENVHATREYLDMREKAGYSLMKVMFKPDDASVKPFEVEAYISHGDKLHYAGPSDVEVICQTIIHSHGPSGSNMEYALLLAEILHKQAPHVPMITSFKSSDVSLSSTRCTTLRTMEKMGINISPAILVQIFSLVLRFYPLCTFI